MTKSPDEFVAKLRSESETGMGYQIVTITLANGSKFNRGVVIEGCIAQVRGYDRVPFETDHIANVELTHDKWDFNKGGTNG
jgi:hypothetical protein